MIAMLKNFSSKIRSLKWSNLKNNLSFTAGSQDREKVNWNDTPTKVLAVPCIAVFLWAWFEQYQSNLIFANLRKDKKSGKVVTEDHGVPHGRLFQHVSSPHRMCELLMYTVLLLLMPTKTFICIYLWVLANQVCCYYWTKYYKSIINWFWIFCIIITNSPFWVTTEWVFFNILY